MEPPFGTPPPAAAPYWQGRRTYRSRTAMIVVLSRTSAMCLPMHFPGPIPKRSIAYRYDAGDLFKKRSGRKISASGPQTRGFVWSRRMSMTVGVPAGMRYPPMDFSTAVHSAGENTESCTSESIRWNRGGRRLGWTCHDLRSAGLMRSDSKITQCSNEFCSAM